MKRREAEFTTKFFRWVRYMWPDNLPAYWELKVSRTTSLPFSAVSDKQLANLQIKKFSHKFSDYERNGTPFDGITFCGQGYVVVYYYRPRNKLFYIIPIEDFLKEKETSRRKSLLEARADQIGQRYLLG